MLNMDPAQQAKDKLERIATTGRDTRWKPGQSGNPKGAPKAKVNFWPHVQRFSEMSPEDFASVDMAGLTMSQTGAYHFVASMAEGDWQRIKEALDRDEGPIVKKVEQALTHTGAITHVHDMPPAEAETQAMAMLDRTAEARQLQTGAVKLLPGLPTPAKPVIDTTATPTPAPADTKGSIQGGGAGTDMGAEVERCVGDT